MTDTIAQPRTALPRRPWLAAVLTFLTPSLGHVYAGQARRGILMVSALYVAAPAGLLLSMYLPNPVLRLGIVLLFIGPSIYVIADAWRQANAAGSMFVPRAYNRWYIYVGMAAGFAFVVQPAYTAGIRRTVAEAFHFPGDNMDPTILRGDYLLAVPRLWRKLDQGDVVVIRMDDGRRVIRRIVGLPGDTLEMRAKVLMVNGDRQTESYVRHIDPNGDPSLADFLWQREFLADGDPEEADYAPSRDHWGPLVVPEDHYFLLGDNRDNSYDSRYDGFVADGDIVGRAGWIYFSRNPDTGDIRWARAGGAIR